MLKTVHKMLRTVAAFVTGVYVGQEYATLPRVERICKQVASDVQAKLREYSSEEDKPLDQSSYTNITNSKPPRK